MACKSNNQKEIAELYQPLFDLMYNEHEIILTQSQMDDIIIACDKVKLNYISFKDERAAENVS